MTKKFQLVILSMVVSLTIYSQNIMTIGDSNGSGSNGWPAKLQQELPDATIINHSIPGNTIGFDNLGNKKLNTLRNIDRYIDSTIEKLGGKQPDKIVICLGTNDCKKIFDGMQKEAAKNMEKLIIAIQNKLATCDGETTIYIVTPPPTSSDEFLKDKYKGGNKRINKLLPGLRKVSKKYGCELIDLNKAINPIFHYMSKDGIHFIEEGQVIIARYIKDCIK